MTPAATTRKTAEKPAEPDQPKLDGDGKAPAEEKAPEPAPSFLPTAKTQPTLSAETAKVVLYGPPKIGKTTTVAAIDPDHTLILATEDGYGALEAFVHRVTSWAEFRQVGPELVKGGHPFKTIAIDTVDELFKFCTDQVMKDLGIKHPSDLEYGKGWSAVTDEFRLRVGAICSLGLGVWFVSHAQDKNVKTRTGEISVTTPSISGRAKDWLLGFVDYILLARSEVTADGEARVVRTVATENFEAGARIALPDPLPLDAAAIKAAMLESIGDKAEEASE